MSRSKLTETMRKLEAQMDAKEGIVPDVELSMSQNPWLSYEALEHIRQFGEPAQARELEWALHEYGANELAQSPEAYWFAQEAADADADY